MVFTTFQFKVCTTCKCEVTDGLVEDKNLQSKRAKSRNDNPATWSADEFDFGAVQNVAPKTILGPDDYDDLIELFDQYNGMD